MIHKIVKEIDDNYRFYCAIAFRHLKNHEDAADAVQNACLKICKYCPSSLPARKLRSWISIVCSNESKTLLRIRQKYSISDSYLLFSQEPVSPYGNPDDLEFYYEGITYAAMQTVPKKYHSALAEHFKFSVPLLKVALKYGIPESNLRYWKRKAEKKLKDFL